MEENDILGNIKEELKGYKRRLKGLGGACLYLLLAGLIFFVPIFIFVYFSDFLAHHLPPRNSNGLIAEAIAHFRYFGKAGLLAVPLFAVFYALLMRPERSDYENSALNGQPATKPNPLWIAFLSAVFSLIATFVLLSLAYGAYLKLNRYDGAPVVTAYCHVAHVANLRTSGNKYGVGKRRYNAVTLQVGPEPDDTYCLKIFNSGTDTAYFGKLRPGQRVKVQVATGRFGVKYVVGERILGVWRPEAKPAMRRLGAVKDTVRIIADTLDVRDPVAGTIERQLAMGCHATIDGEPAETLYDEKALSSALQAAAKAGSTVELHRPMGDGKVEVLGIKDGQVWTKPSYDEPTLSDITYALKRGKATLLIGGNEAQPDRKAINAALDAHRPVCLRFATSTGARTRYRFMPLD